MASAETFKGYGPEQGYGFLRDAISAYYARNGVSVDAADIFISDGAKSDTGNISELFDNDNVILIPDPVYPVYVDSNIMNGKKLLIYPAMQRITFFRCQIRLFMQILSTSAPRIIRPVLYTIKIS